MAIAVACAGTRVHEKDLCLAVTNSFAHPICNFAICRDNPELNLTTIGDMARSRASFNVYVSHYQAENYTHAIFESAGFRRLYSLVQMYHPGSCEPMEQVLERASDERSRKRISEFMIWQFFSSQSPSVRAQISRATTRSAQLELYGLALVEVDASLAGAVMLHRTSGVLGLYNLCVASAHRSHGYGSAIVVAIESLAMQENVILGLQCDPRLASWYEGLGLQEVGTVDVYGLKTSISYNVRE